MGRPFFPQGDKGQPSEARFPGDLVSAPDRNSILGVSVLLAKACQSMPRRGPLPLGLKIIAFGRPATDSCAVGQHAADAASPPNAAPVLWGLCLARVRIGIFFGVSLCRLPAIRSLSLLAFQCLVVICFHLTH